MARYRIFLVDDDPDIRAVMAAALRPKFEIVEASDGLEALHKLTNYQPDFAVLDAVMPVMDGFQLCEAIRKHREFRAIPVLFLSASSSQESIRKGYASGANLYITKPADPLRVLKNIEFTIEHDKPELRRKRFTIEELKHVDELEARRASEEETTAKTQGPGSSPRRESEAPQAAPTMISDSEELDYDPAILEEDMAPRQNGPARKPRIMIVENEDDPRKLMTLALRDDYEVTHAVDGVDAIEKIVRYQPDLMLMDIMMPKMNGYQLLQTIRRNRVYGLLPIIVVSGKSTKRDQDYALRLGATACVGKPFTPDQLLEAVEGVTQAVDFEVPPKRHSIEEILAMEKPADEPDPESHPAHKGHYSELEKMAREGNRGTGR